MQEHDKLPDVPQAGGTKDKSIPSPKCHLMKSQSIRGRLESQNVAKHSIRQERAVLPVGYRYNTEPRALDYPFPVHIGRNGYPDSILTWSYFLLLALSYLYLCTSWHYQALILSILLLALSLYLSPSSLCFFWKPLP